MALAASESVSRNSSFSARCRGWVIADVDGDLMRLEAGANQPVRCRVRPPPHARHMTGLLWEDPRGPIRWPGRPAAVHYMGREPLPSHDTVIVRLAQGMNSAHAKESVRALRWVPLKYRHTRTCMPCGGSPVSYWTTTTRGAAPPAKGRWAAGRTAFRSRSPTGEMDCPVPTYGEPCPPPSGATGWTMAGRELVARGHRFRRPGGQQAFDTGDALC